MEKAIIEMEYGITEAAVRLGMKARTVREWIRNGKIKAHKNTSGKWVIMENEIGRIIGKDGITYCDEACCQKGEENG